MRTDHDDHAWDIELGYKLALTDKDLLVKERLLYHGRLGGDLAELRNVPMFFYAEGGLSSVFSEHIFLNGDNTWAIAAATNSEEEFNEAYLSHSPVIFPLRVTIDNPIVLDRFRLLDIAEELGVVKASRDKFVAEFEDSNADIRNQVFEWVQLQGFDGAILANDWTPEVAGGDSCYRTSYVAFNPLQQVRFVFNDYTCQPNLEVRSGSQCLDTSRGQKNLQLHHCLGE